MQNTAIRAALGALILAIGNLPAKEIDSLCAASIRNHFEWGEYDSLIAKVTPLLSALDSPAACQYRLYLGVAYFAAGRIAEARRQFETGIGCDSGLGLDARYVSEEILDIFTLVRSDHRRKIAEKDSLDAVETARAAAARQSLLAAQTVQRKRRARAISFAFWGGAVALAAGSAVTYAAMRDRYYEFLAAAGEGNARIYEQRRSQLQTANALIAIAGIGSAVCAGAGLTVSIKGQRNRPAEPQ